MGREEVVIWAGRGLLYADKPTCRKAAPSKTEDSTQTSTWIQHTGRRCIKSQRSYDFPPNLTVNGFKENFKVIHETKLLGVLVTDDRKAY